MIILGINEDHNATAAIIKDGKVLACASEERFSRKKNDTEYPFLAIESLLKSTGIAKHQIDAVAFAGIDFDPEQMRIKRTTKYSINDYVREMHGFWKKVLIEKKESNFFQELLTEPRFSKEGLYYDYSFMETAPRSEWPELSNKSRSATVCRHLEIDASKVHFVDHHSGHSYYGFFASPHSETERAVIVTVDGIGDGCNATISVFENNEIKEIHRTNTCNIGRMYRWQTLLLGMKPNEHEYKVMGLAPYAKDYIKEPAYKIYKETLAVDGLSFIWKNKPSDMYFYFRDRLEGIRFDGIAGGLQQWVEELLCEWIENIMKHTNTSTLYLSGGVSMNVKANKMIGELSCVKQLHVPPSAGDESLAIGAAYYLCKKFGGKPLPLETTYLGYSPTKEECQEAVNKFRSNPLYAVIDNPTDDQIAQYMANGKVFGRCVGNMEFGARSLGNRAILCDPSKPENLRNINEKIKFRDFWMPFTPSILEERGHDYLNNPKNIPAYFMTIGFDSTDLGKKHLTSAIHPYDFTVRPQLVNSEKNPKYYSLIKAFEKITGIGAVLNTSLNLHGSPIVRTADEAIQTLVESGLDGMIFEDILLLKL
jgi:carbamoyltransferase